MGACYQGTHLIYSEMDRLDSDAVSTTSSYNTRGIGGMPSQTHQNSRFSISCILETYDKHVRFRMTAFCLSQMKTGLHLPRCCQLKSCPYMYHVVFLHLKGKILLFCLFTQILPTCKIRGAVASWLVHSTPGRAARVRDLVGDIALCSWARHFTLTVPLFTQVYKWVPANLMLGVTLRWTSIPSRGEQKYSQSLHATETGISSGLMGHLACMQT